MKKNNLLKTVLLLMFSALLLIGCRDETVSIVKQEHSEITKLSSGYYTMQQTPVFKNFLDKEYLKISKIINLKNKNAKLSQSDQQIYVVSKDDKTSYSTKINKTSTGFDILVYTIVGEKESFFVAEFVSDDKNSGDSINNFTGNVKYRTLDGKIVGDLYFKNGRPESQNSRTQRTAGCTTTTITVAISCTSQEHHMPWETCYLSEGRAYYEVTAVTLCNEDYQDSLYNDLSGGGYFGGYDGGYDSSGERPLYGLKGVLATNIEMQTLFNNLSTDKKFFIINNFNTTEDQEFAFFSINFFSQNPNTTIEQFQNWFIEGDQDFNRDLLKMIVENNHKIPQYTSSDFPGMNNGMPYNWWNDENYLNNMSLGFNNINLTKEEKKMCALFPLAAVMIFSNKDIALNEASSTFPNQIPRNNKADAFRHAFFNALNIRDVYSQFSTRGTFTFAKNIVRMFGIAHQSEVPQELLLEKAMDLYNNERGIEVCSTCNPLTNPTNLVKGYVLSLLNEGKLVHIWPLNNDQTIRPDSNIYPTNQH